MDKSKAGRMLRERRMNEKKSQQQMSMDLFQSREYITKQESGERKIAPATAHHFTKTYNDPWLGLQAAFEYTGIGITKLDGPAVDLHRTAVQAKLEEELGEAIEAMNKAKLTNRPEFAKSYELQDIEKSAREFIDVVHASTTYVATICQEYNISWTQLWEDHHRKLQSRGYVTT
ncbi:XRE family transcriptional regulator [Halobacillus trueperi]|uniref:XRE family transcriptional regulator n=1 Tax=Halobacillus trueperi TaxID=156205 RepID=A0A3D8VLK7_9BACI|nr:XRE family transcriptional regulator [Halobacillus trueperi]RDY70286.1 XRE family transcriptional regulator [Halobacillus trueperi]